MTAIDSDAIELDPAHVAALDREGAVALVDVRTPDEVAEGRIAGAAHIPLEQLSGRAGELPEDRPLVFYCRVGARSMMAAQALRAAGRDAHSLAGGLVAWHGHGLPLDPADGRVADH